MKLGKTVFNLVCVVLVTASGAFAEEISPYHWRPVPDEVMWIGDIHCVQKFNGAHYFGDDGGIIKWDGTKATRVRGITGSVYTMTQHAGTLYVGGKFPGTQFLGMTEPQNSNIRILKDNQWQSLPGSSLSDTVRALHHDGIYLHAGGDFTNAGGDADADYIAFHNGTNWQSLGGSGSGLAGAVHTIASNAGTIFAGGDFLDAGGDSNADRIAKYESGAWSSLGGASPGLNDTVHKILFRQNTLYACGDFTEASGLGEAAGLAFHEDGPQWWPVTNDPIPGISDFELVGTKIVIAGSFTDANAQPDADYLAELDVSQYHIFSQVGNGFNVKTHGIYHDGETLITFGSFRDANGNTAMDFVARLDGDDWVPMFHLNKGVHGTVHDILLAGGVIYIAGDFKDAGGDEHADGVAKLENGVWQSLGGADSGIDGIGYTLSLHDGVLYVGGDFDNAGGDSNADNLAQFKGGELSSLSDTGTIDGIVYDLLFHEDVLYIAGDFIAPAQFHGNKHIIGFKDNAFINSGNAIDGPIKRLASQDSYLYATGHMEADHPPYEIGYLSRKRWISNSWQSIPGPENFYPENYYPGSFPGKVHSMLVHEQKVHISGDFNFEDDNEDTYQYFATYDGFGNWDNSFRFYATDMKQFGDFFHYTDGRAVFICNNKMERFHPVYGNFPEFRPYGAWNATLDNSVVRIDEANEGMYAVGGFQGNSFGDSLSGISQIRRNFPPNIFGANKYPIAPSPYLASPFLASKRKTFTISDHLPNAKFSHSLSAEDPDHDVDTLKWEVPTRDSRFDPKWSARRIKSYPRYGEVTIIGNGENVQIQYKRVHEGGGFESFTVYVEDPEGGYDLVNYIVHIDDLNDAPEVTEGDSITHTIVNDGTPLTFELNATDPDEEDISFTWSLATPASSGTASVSGTGDKQTVSYTPNAGFVGNDSFMVKAADDGGLFDSITVNVVVKENPTPPTPANEAPVASVGVDQSVEEGSTVTLDSSASSDDNGIASFKWSVVSGLPITFSNDLAANPTFVAPPVPVEGGQTVIQLDITDEQGLASSDTLTVTYTDNGLTQFSDTAVPVMPSDDSMEPLALEPPTNASIVKLTTMTMEEMPDAPGAPDSMPNGLLDFQLKPDEPGAEVQMVVYLSSPAPANAGWAKFQNNEWIDYSEHAEFSADRRSVTLTFVDGGIGDDDGIVNGFISDPSGMTVPAATSTPSSSSGGGGGGGGCLIRGLR